MQQISILTDNISNKKSMIWINGTYCISFILFRFLILRWFTKLNKSEVMGKQRSTAEIKNKI